MMCCYKLHTIILIIKLKYLDKKSLDNFALTILYLFRPHPIIKKAFTDIHAFDINDISGITIFPNLYSEILY